MAGADLREMVSTCRACFDAVARLSAQATYDACLIDTTSAECRGTRFQSTATFNTCLQSLHPGTATVPTFTIAFDTSASSCSIDQETALWSVMGYGGFLRCIRDNDVVLSDFEMRQCIWEFWRRVSPRGRSLVGSDCANCVLDLAVAVSRHTGTTLAVLFGSIDERFTSVLENSGRTTPWNSYIYSYEKCGGYAGTDRHFYFPQNQCVNRDLTLTGLSSSALVIALIRCAGIEKVSLKYCSAFRASTSDDFYQRIYSFVATPQFPADVACGTCFSDFVDGFLARAPDAGLDACINGSVVDLVGTDCTNALEIPLRFLNRCNGKYDVANGDLFCSYYDNKYRPLRALLEVGYDIAVNIQTKTDQENLDAASALIAVYSADRLDVGGISFNNAMYIGGVISAGPLSACADCMISLMRDVGLSPSANFHASCPSNVLDPDCLNSAAISTALNTFKTCAGMTLISSVSCDAPATYFLSIGPLVTCAIAKMDNSNTDTYKDCFTAEFGLTFADAWTATSCDSVYYSVVETITAEFDLNASLLAVCDNISSDCWDGLEKAGLVDEFNVAIGHPGIVLNIACSVAEFILFKSWDNTGSLVIQEAFTSCVTALANIDTCYSGILGSYTGVTCEACLKDLLVTAATVMNTWSDEQKTFCAVEPFSIGCQIFLAPAFQDFEICTGGFKYPETLPDQSAGVCGDTTGWWDDSRLYDAILNCVLTSGTSLTQLVDCPVFASPAGGSWEARVVAAMSDSDCAGKFNIVISEFFETKDDFDLAVRCAVDFYSQPCLELTLATRANLGAEKRELVTGEAIYRPSIIDTWFMFVSSVNPYQKLANLGVDTAADYDRAAVFAALGSDGTDDDPIIFALQRFTANMRSLVILNGKLGVPLLDTNKCDEANDSFFTMGCELEAGSIDAMSDFVRVSGGYLLETRESQTDACALLGQVWSLPYKALITAATASFASGTEEWKQVNANDALGDLFLVGDDGADCKLCFDQFIDRVQSDTMIDLVSCAADPFDADCASQMYDHVTSPLGELMICGGITTNLSTLSQACDSTAWSDNVPTKYRSHDSFTKCAINALDWDALAACTLNLRTVNNPSCIDCFEVYVNEVFTNTPAECTPDKLAVISDECYAALNAPGGANYRFEFCSGHTLLDYPGGVCSWAEWEPIQALDIPFELVVLILRMESSAVSAIARLQETLVDLGISNFNCRNCFRQFINSMFTLSSTQRIQCTQEFYSDACQFYAAAFLSAFHTCAGYKLGWSVVVPSTHKPTKAPRPEPLTTSTMTTTTFTTENVTSSFNTSTAVPFDITTSGTTAKGSRFATNILLISVILIGVQIIY